MSQPLFLCGCEQYEQNEEYKNKGQYFQNIYI